jgi:hypothetical protein
MVTLEAEMDTLIADKVIDQLKYLPDEAQQQVLEFARSLALSLTPRGISGKDLLRFAGTISPEDLKIMSEVIEQDCEQINANEW